jgi:hypothetical protein
VWSFWAVVSMRRDFSKHEENDFARCTDDVVHRRRGTRTGEPAGRQHQLIRVLRTGSLWIEYSSDDDNAHRRLPGELPLHADASQRGGAELQFFQNSIKYNTIASPFSRVHSREQELSAAYVYQRTYKRYNPFVEGGVGAEIFTPILDNGTTQKGLKQSLQIGGLFGGGVAYELSPSWDIRAEYRGFMMKAPTFGATDGLFTTNRYYILMTPSIGVAYHF